MSALAKSAPALEVRDVKQIAALPLGGRIKLDAWSDQLTIQKTQAVPLMSAREKMPFQITPMFPYLTLAETTPPTGKSVPPVEPPAPSAEVKPDTPHNSQPQ